MPVNRAQKIKRLTKHMLEVLMDCHERELMKLEPCHTTNTRYIRGLIERGYLKSKILIAETGKRIVVFYVTELGAEYLSKL